MSEENLSLWKSVEKTNPSHTKKFTKGGGFSGTAINATSIIRRATELWGPCGGDWWYEIVDDRIVDGASWHGIDTEGETRSGRDKIHILRINLFYPGCKHPITHFGQTVFVGKNKNGTFTDDEAPKKSLTDAITKALSMLGFSADIYLGLYDDNKYVEALHDEFHQEEKGGADKGLLGTLDAAASHGISSYQSVWRGLTAEQRKSIGMKRHEMLKEVSLKNSTEEERKAYQQMVGK